MSLALPQKPASTEPWSSRTAFLCPRHPAPGEHICLSAARGAEFLSAHSYNPSTQDTEAKTVLKQIVNLFLKHFCVRHRVDRVTEMSLHEPPTPVSSEDFVSVAHACLNIRPKGVISSPTPLSMSPASQRTVCVLLLTIVSMPWLWPGDSCSPILNEGWCLEDSLEAKMSQGL